jgi:tripartite-type tricarboxylate transporter receptor subunit TctC
MAGNRRLTSSLLILFAAVFASAQSAAQDFPNKPLRIIVAESPGTTTDIIARVMAPEMSRLLGQPIVIEQKLGAGSIIGLEYVAKQVPADGYTSISVSVTSLATLPLTVKDLRFDPLRDLPPYIGLAEGRLIFGTSPKLPWKNFKEMMSSAKATPGKLNYGASSPQVRFPMLMLVQDLGLDVVSIPYSAGGPYLQALVAGEVHMGFMGEAAAIGFGERLRMLAVTGDKPSVAVPDIPTFAQLGHPQVPGVGYSFNLPALTPKAAIDKLNAAASRALGNAEVRAGLGKLRLDILDESPETAAKNLAQIGRNYADIARKMGIQPQ